MCIVTCAQQSVAFVAYLFSIKLARDSFVYLYVTQWKFYHSLYRREYVFYRLLLCTKLDRLLLVRCCLWFYLHYYIWIIIVYNIYLQKKNKDVMRTADRSEYSKL